MTGPQPPETDQAVIALYRQGLTQAQVAAKTGLSRNQVHRVLRFHGVPSRRRGQRSWGEVHGPQAEQQVIDAYLSGRSLAEAGKPFGAGHSAVRLILKRRGVPRRPAGRPRVRPLPPADVTGDGDRLLVVAEVAKALRISKPTVYRLIRHGELAAIRLGPRGTRVREAAVLAYLRSRPKVSDAAIGPDGAYTRDQPGQHV
jgi:excisionase family DNA binding protein